MAGTSAGSPPPNHSFERYTPKAREALFYSRYEAAQAGSVEIAPGHLLLGLVRAGQAFASRIFGGLSLEEAKTLIMADAPPQPALGNSHVIPFNEATKSALLKAVAEADRHGHSAIGIVHVVLGLLHDETSAAAAVVTTAGIHAAGIRQDIERLVNEEAAM